MPEDSQKQRSRLGPGDGVPMSALVARWLRHGPGDADARDSLDRIVFRMVEACLALESECLDHVTGLLTDNGVSACLIAEDLVPRVARELGDMWCEDNLAFSRVTIGCSRLQGLLRYLGPDWYGAIAGETRVPDIVLVVPSGENHTMGGLVMTGRLRRLGHGVRAIMGEKADEVAGIVSQCDSDLVMISTSRHDNLEQLSELVEKAREASRARAIVVIGGSILIQDDVCRDRILSGTGADLVTNDLDEALQACRRTNGHSIRPPHGTDASRRTT